MGSDLTPPPGLFVSGLCHDGPDTIALISPDEPGFWRIFTESPEYADGLADPMDRWSHRVIEGWAKRIGADALFPSDPPYPPFAAWALRSGQAWSSPVHMLVHDRMGLFISFRGALRIAGHLSLPPENANPCPSCAQPCRTACPVNAFPPTGYDTAACHGWLDTAGGAECMTGGCLVRRACPISQGCGRLPQQSAWHMRHFHP